MSGHLRLVYFMLARTCLRITGTRLAKKFELEAMTCVGERASAGVVRRREGAYATGNELGLSWMDRKLESGVVF